MGGPVTVGDLIRDRRLLWVYCLRCCRERDLEPATLDLSPDEPVPGLGRRRMVCSACGSREVDTRPDLYPGGVKAARAARGG